MGSGRSKGSKDQSDTHGAVAAGLGFLLIGSAMMDVARTQGC